MTKKQLEHELNEARRNIRTREQMIEDLRRQISYKENSYACWVTSLKAHIAALELAIEVYKDTIEVLRGESYDD